MILVVTVVVASAGAVYSQEVISVETAVRLALDNNLSLKRDALAVGVLKRGSNRSWNSLIPSLGASVGASHPMSLTNYDYGERDVWTPGFNLSANLTLSTSIVSNIRKAQIDYEQGLLTYELARQELELQIRKLFYWILLLDANRALAAQNFESAQSRHAQSAALARVGQAPRLDELSARVDMENLRPTARNAEMEYENTLDYFKSVLGISAETVISLDGNLAGELAAELSGAQDISGESLEIASLRKSIQSMKAQRNAYRTDYYVPYLNLSWNSQPLYNLQNKNWTDSTGSFSVSLGIYLDNFLPWSSAKTRIDDIGDNINSAQILLTDTLRNRENRLSQYIRTVETILESLGAIKLNVELAESTYSMYEDAYRRGAADYQQLRSSGDSLEQAKNRFLQEQYNLISALLDLEKELNIPFGSLFSEEE